MKRGVSLQTRGYSLVIISALICFCIFSVKTYGVLAPLYNFDESGKSVTSVSLKTEENQTSQNQSPESDEAVSSQAIPSGETLSAPTQSTQSVPVSAGAVAGNILSKYVSPYNAGASYNKVYVKNSTDAKIDIKKILESPLKFNITANTDQPQVLIVHTHATESFMQTDSKTYTEDFKSRSTDNNINMVKIGSIVAEKLNTAGIKTLHSDTQHDYPKYTGSYSRSAETINWYLKKYPSIKIVLDLHRDAISSNNGDKTKLVTKINDKNAAQVMLVMGSQTGSVKNHPNWQENLKLAFKLQQKMEEKYPTLARPLYLTSKVYNQNLTTGSLLLEFGTDANTLNEVCYSAELVGNTLVDLLK